MPRRRRRQELSYRYIVTGPNGTRGGTVIALDRAEAETMIPLKSGERLYALVLEHACSTYR